MRLSGFACSRDSEIFRTAFQSIATQSTRTIGRKDSPEIELQKYSESSRQIQLHHHPLPRHRHGVFRLPFDQPGID